MPPNSFPRKLLAILAAVAVVLVLTIAVVLALGALLGAMDDGVGRSVMNWIALGLSVPFVVDLFGLVVLLAIHALANADEP